MKRVQDSNEEMKKKLSPELYKIAVEKETESPFTGKYVFTKDTGTYNCAVCKNPLFSSETKFESVTGWPSFYEPIKEDSVKYHEDKSLGMTRTEITCGKCGSHIGHVFDDGPKPTGKRYCINCVSLDLKKD